MSHELAVISLSVENVKTSSAKISNEPQTGMECKFYLIRNTPVTY